MVDATAADSNVVAEIDVDATVETLVVDVDVDVGTDADDAIAGALLVATCSPRVPQLAASATSTIAQVVERERRRDTWGTMGRAWSTNVSEV